MVDDGIAPVRRPCRCGEGPLADVPGVQAPSGRAAVEARAGAAPPPTSTRASSSAAPSPAVSSSAASSSASSSLAWSEGLPGPDLVHALTTAALPPGEDADHTLVEAIAAWERVIAWSAAQQAALIGRLAAVRDSNKHWDFVADEIACRLAITRTAARSKVELAIALTDRPAVLTMLASGIIDQSKARVVVDELAAVPLAAEEVVLAAAQPEIPGATTSQIRTSIRRAALTVDPQASQRRAERERGRRCVVLTPAPESMARLVAYLPADAAATCFTALDALAAAARTPEDDRGIDARRADALTDVLRQVLDTGVSPYGALPSQQHRRPHIQVTVAARTLLGLDDDPGELAGYGPVPASMARRIAQDGTWRRITVAESGEVVHRAATTYRPGADLTGTVTTRDRTCTFPGCAVPAWRCDVDHIEPFDVERPAADQTVADNLHSLCRHHHRLKTHAPWRVARDAATGSTTWRAPTGHVYQRAAERLPGAPQRARATTQPREPVHAFTGRPAPAASGARGPDVGHPGETALERRGQPPLPPGTWPLASP